MGRKVHPIGFRLNINKPWDGRWYADGDEYVDQLHQDLEIRKLIHAQTGNAGVSRVEVERFPGKVKVVVNTAKPGILIGRKGESVKIIRKQLETLTGKKCDLEIKEIKNPDLDAYLVGMNIAGHHQYASGIAYLTGRQHRFVYRVAGTVKKITQIHAGRKGNRCTRTIHYLRKVQKHSIPSSQSCLNII